MDMHSKDPIKGAGPNEEKMNRHSYLLGLAFDPEGIPVPLESSSSFPSASMSIASRRMSKACISLLNLLLAVSHRHGHGGLYFSIWKRQMTLPDFPSIFPYAKLVAATGESSNMKGRAGRAHLRRSSYLDSLSESQHDTEIVERSTSPLFPLADTRPSLKFSVFTARTHTWDEGPVSHVDTMSGIHTFLEIAYAAARVDEFVPCPHCPTFDERFKGSEVSKARLQTLFVAIGKCDSCRHGQGSYTPSGNGLLHLYLCDQNGDFLISNGDKLSAEAIVSPLMNNKLPDAQDTAWWTNVALALGLKAKLIPQMILDEVHADTSRGTWSAENLSLFIAENASQDNSRAPGESCFPSLEQFLALLPSKPKSTKPLVKGSGMSAPSAPPVSSTNSTPTPPRGSQTAPPTSSKKYTLNLSSLGLGSASTEPSSSRPPKGTDTPKVPDSILGEPMRSGSSAFRPPSKSSNPPLKAPAPLPDSVSSSTSTSPSKSDQQETVPPVANEYSSKNTESSLPPTASPSISSLLNSNPLIGNPSQIAALLQSHGGLPSHQSAPLPLSLNPQMFGPLPHYDQVSSYLSPQLLNSLGYSFLPQQQLPLHQQVGMVGNPYPAFPGAPSHPSSNPFAYNQRLSGLLNNYNLYNSPLTTLPFGANLMQVQNDNPLFGSVLHQGLAPVRPSPSLLLPPSQSLINFPADLSNKELSAAPLKRKTPFDPLDGSKRSPSKKPKYQDPFN